MRIRSVSEALRSALIELHNSEETYGVDLDSTGCRRPTDVLRKSAVPKQWQTLTEKVGWVVECLCLINWGYCGKVCNLKIAELEHTA